MDKELSAASVHECLFVDILSKEEHKKVSGTQSADVALPRGLTWDLHADVACHVATLTGGGSGDSWQATWHHSGGDTWPSNHWVRGTIHRLQARVRSKRFDGGSEGSDGDLVRIKAGLVYVGPWRMAGGLVNEVGPKMGKQVLVEPR
uniref:Uncharacterized protein n=1 Tax=Tanacetum cinerariifolium TaxID=118510 RepID=A0A6L2M2V9_TANCI|nr:hypothetical protein [Tanacetum cinerariifolium]